MRDEDDAPQCEGCLKEIHKGDKYTTTLDGCDLCEDCAPSFQDCVDHYIEFPPEDDEEREIAEANRKNLAAHVAAGGSPDDKPLWIME